MTTFRSSTLLKTLLFGAVLLALPALAAEDAAKKEMRLHVIADDDSAELELPELEVGESRTLYTKAGEPIEVERTEEGLRVEVAGREVLVATEGLSGQGYAFSTGDGEEGAVKKLVVLADGDVGATGAAAVVLSGDGETKVIRKQVEVGEDGERKVTVKVLSGDEVDEEGDVIIVGDEGDAETRVIRKRVVVGEDGEEKEVRVKVIAGEGGEGEEEVIILPADEDGDGEPVVVKVRVKKEKKGDAEN